MRMLPAPGLALWLSMAVAMGASGSPFTQVPRGNWSYAFVNGLVGSGIIPGYRSGIGADEVLSRLELATLVSKLLGSASKALAGGTLGDLEKARLQALETEFSEELALLAQPGHEAWEAVSRTPAPAPAPEVNGKPPAVAPAVAPAKPAATATIAPGKGLVVKGPDGRKIMLGARFQVLSQHDQFDDQPQGAVAPKQDTSGFSVRRAKLYSELALHPKTEFRLQFEAAGAGGRLDDAVFRWNADHAFKLWAGQFKTPVSRESIQSTRELLFVDRALAAAVFGFNNPSNTVPTAIGSIRGLGVGRNPGLQIWGDTSENPTRERNLRYFFHLANGPGQNLGNENDGYAYMAKLEFHPWGDPGYVQGAQPTDDRARLALDVAFLTEDRQQIADLDGNAIVNLRDRQQREMVALGYQLRAGRWSSQGELFRNWGRPEVTTVRGVTAEGGYAQLGYLFERDKWEAAVKYGWIDPDQAALADTQREKAIGLNYYIRGHFEKLQADWTRLTDDRNQTFDEDRFRLQYQYTF